MDKIQTFFEFISDYCEKLDMNIILSSKKGIVTMAIFFKSKDEETHIPELIITGTPEQLDANFYDALKPSLNKVIEMTDNIEFFNKQIARVTSEKEKKATGKKTSVTKKKTSTVKSQTVEGMKTAKAEEIPIAPTGQTGNMFKESVEPKGKAPLEKATEKNQVVAEPTKEQAETEPAKQTDAFSSGIQSDINDDF